MIPEEYFNQCEECGELIIKGNFCQECNARRERELDEVA